MPRHVDLKRFGKDPIVAKRRREVFELRLKGLDAYQIYKVMQQKYGDRWTFETYKKDYTFAGKITFEMPDFNKARSDAIQFYRMQLKEVYSMLGQAEKISERLEIIRTANNIAREMFRLMGIGHDINLEINNQDEYKKILKEYFGIDIEGENGD